MMPTRARPLVLTAVVCAAGMWLLLHEVYTSLPVLPWSGVPALALLAIAEAICGRSVRARLHGRGTPIPPIAVARLAVLAKASSLAGAAIGGGGPPPPGLRGPAPGQPPAPPAPPPPPPP